MIYHNVFYMSLIQLIDIQDGVDLKPPKCPQLGFKLLRLLANRSMTSSYQVSKTDGLDDRVKEVNEKKGTNFKAGIMMLLHHILSNINNS